MQVSKEFEGFSPIGHAVFGPSKASIVQKARMNLTAALLLAAQPKPGSLHTNDKNKSKSGLARRKVRQPKIFAFLAARAQKPISERIRNVPVPTICGPREIPIFLCPVPGPGGMCIGSRVLYVYWVPGPYTIKYVKNQL